MASRCASPRSRPEMRTASLLWPQSFHQLGVLSAADPAARLPDGFFDVAPATPTQMLARAFDTLPELRGASADALPSVLLVDAQSDARLRERVDEAWAVLAPLPGDARPAVLALLISSWLGGHVYADTESAERQRAAAECTEWRREHNTNVRPIGEVRRGGARARSLLFKFLFDEVILRLEGTSKGGESEAYSCELRRARSGRYECHLKQRESVHHSSSVQAAPMAGICVDLHA